ncbi:NAD-dependent epimerase/dehydratase family protein [Escherichia coli]
MKALARFGKAFGGYKMIDVPQPMCGPEDVVIEIKAAAGNDSNLLIVFYVQIMPDDFVMQLHRF